MVPGVNAGRRSWIFLLAGAAWLCSAALRADDWEQINSLQNRVRELRKAFRSAEALPLAQQAVSRAQRLAEQPLATASFVYDLALVYYDQGRFTDAEPHYRRAAAIYEGDSRADSKDVVLVLCGHADCLHRLSKYAAAEAIYRRALAKHEQALGAEHGEIALTLDGLGHVVWHQARYPESEAIAKRSLSIREKAYGPDHPSVADSLLTFRNTYDSQGRYAELEPLLKRALAIHEKASGADSPAVSEALAALGQVYHRLGRYVEAEQLNRRSLAIQEKTDGDNPAVANELRSVAHIYWHQGRYAEAEPLLKRAMAIHARNAESDQYNFAMCIGELGNVYEAQGRLEEAASLYQRLVAIRQRIHDPNHPDVAEAMGSLANVYITLERYADAEPLIERTRAIHSQTAGGNDEDNADALHTLGRLKKAQGNLKEAEKLYREALALKEKVLGTDHPRVASTLDGLGDLFYQQGKYDEALELVDRAIASRDRAMVAADERYGSYYLRAQIAWALKEKEEALDDLRKAMDLAEQARSQVSGAENERAVSFDLFSDAFESMVAWQCELGDAREALMAIERSRARSLLDEMQTSGADLDASRSGVEREALRRRELELKSRIAELEKQSKAEEAAEARAELYEHYRQQRNSNPIYRSLLTAGSGPPRLSQVQRTVVDSGGLLLVYYVGSDASYVVVITERESRVQQLEVSPADAAVLGLKPGPLTADQLQTLLMDEKAGVLPQISRPDSAGPAAPRLAALWRMLIPEAQREDLVSGKLTRLMVVPDGALALLPFETLVVEAAEKPRYLLDVGPPVHYAPSATVLFNLINARTTASDTVSEPILTVGGAIYGNARTALASRIDTGGTSARSRYSTHGGKLQPLPFSDWETGWVADVYTEQGFKSRKLTSQAATEAGVRLHAPGHQIVHFACHGLTDQKYGNFFGALALTPGARAAYDPTDDGFLTLPEIYQLNLKGCELAILSACQTNFGPQQKGEGTWAISRGFLVAGARRVAASNWLVDDEAAASLVSIFCSRLAKDMKAGQVDHAAALQLAKRRIREQEKWSSPYYWGTFVLVGPR